MVGPLDVKQAVKSAFFMSLCWFSSLGACNSLYSTGGDYGSRNTLRILSLLQDEGLEGTVPCWQWFETTSHSTNSSISSRMQLFRC